MSKSTKLETVKGFISKLCKPVEGKNYTISKFMLKLEDGDEIYASVFGDFDQNLVGEFVEVQGEWYDDKNFNVDKDQEILVLDEDLVPEATEKATEEAPVSKGRPEKKAAGRPASKKTATRGGGRSKPSTSRPGKTTKSSVDRAEFAGQAKDSVAATLDVAMGLLDDRGYKEHSATDLVELAGLLGRTQTAIFLDNK